MAEYTDQIGNTIVLLHPPQRIVSLVPSQTELLHTLGLEDQVVGITKFCEHPAHWFQSKTRVGGTKMVNQDTIDQLKPDLIIANKEENERDQVMQLSQRYPVWTSDVHTLDDAMTMIRSIGAMTQTEKEAAELVTTIRDRFTRLPATTIGGAVYLIWKEPYMTVGGDTFIHHLVERCGFINCYSGQSRYPVITPGEINAVKPDFLLLSSEPYPFREKHRREMEALFPSTRVILVDGTYFSWYGSRLLDAPGYFKGLQKEATGNN